MGNIIFIFSEMTKDTIEQKNEMNILCITIFIIYPIPNNKSLLKCLIHELNPNTKATQCTAKCVRRPENQH